MQELLGRIARLDPSASLGLRVIACFDELVVGNVNTRALLAAAASLAGCTAGFRQEDPPRTVRVTPAGEHAAGEPVPAAPTWPMLGDPADGVTVWLERDGEPLANDAIIIERLALAVRVRHGRSVRDHRRHLGVVLDRELAVEDRLEAASALGLQPTLRYRVLAAPLFAVWSSHPSGPEDVIATPHGPIHAMVVPGSSEFRWG